MVLKFLYNLYVYIYIFLFMKKKIKNLKLQNKSKYKFVLVLLSLLPNFISFIFSNSNVRFHTLYKLLFLLIVSLDRFYMESYSYGIFKLISIVIFVTLRIKKLEYNFIYYIILLPSIIDFYKIHINSLSLSKKGIFGVDEWKDEKYLILSFLISLLCLIYIIVYNINKQLERDKKKRQLAFQKQIDDFAESVTRNW